MKSIINTILFFPIIFMGHLSYTTEQNPYLYKIPQGIVKKICGKQKRNLKYYERIKIPKNMIKYEKKNKKKNLQEQLNKINEFIANQTRIATAQDLISLANNPPVINQNNAILEK